MAIPPQKRSSPPGSEAERAELQRQKLGEWGHYAGFGVQYAVTIGVFALIGWKLDGWLGSEPWLLITLLFLGFLGATISLVKQLPTSPRSAPRGGPDR